MMIVSPAQQPLQPPLRNPIALPLATAVSMVSITAFTAVAAFLSSSPVLADTSLIRSPLLRPLSAVALAADARQRRCAGRACTTAVPVAKRAPTKLSCCMARSRDMGDGAGGPGRGLGLRVRRLIAAGGALAAPRQHAHAGPIEPGGMIFGGVLGHRVRRWSIDASSPRKHAGSCRGLWLSGANHPSNRTAIAA